MSDKTVMYHQLKAPKGTLFTRDEAAKLKHGWVDTPAKFHKGFWGNLFDLIECWHKVKLFSLNHLMAVITAFIIFLVGVATIATMLFIHYDTKSANKEIHGAKK